MKIISFDDALEATKHQNNRHILLGNGFSRACRNDIFDYFSLFENADFAALSKHARSVFDALETTDFEVVIEVLRSTAKVVSVYKKDKRGFSKTLKKDADGLREVMVSAIAGSHPDLLSEISDESYQACRKFLSYFKRIFTLNYDLLLYWAVMQKALDYEVKSDDGFRNPEHGEEEYVTWEVENSYNQTIYYLHGALHLFDSGVELQKYTWSKTGVRLKEQITMALEDGKYPLFVAEGKSEEKLEKIKHNAYLAQAFESFSRIGGALFIFGHSLSPNDDHFLKLVEKGKINQLCVSIFGKPNVKANQSIIKRTKQIQKARNSLAATRKRKPPELDIYFFDAESAQPWG